MALAKTSEHYADIQLPHREQWDEILRNGERLLIRPIRKRDLGLERNFFERLSPRSRRFRFLDTIKSPSEALLKQLADIDPFRDLALIALTVGRTTEQEIGVARLCADVDGRSCDVAVTISDEWRRLGVGTVLMRHLVDGALARGIVAMHSVGAANNEPMRGFAHHLGFRRRIDPDDSTKVVHTLLLKPRRSDSLATSSP